MDIIRCHLEGQHQFWGLAWLRYDEQFRAQISTMPGKSWMDIDQELWL